MRPERTVRTIDDVLVMLDGLFVDGVEARTGGAAWWDSFYSDRARPIPFFVTKPDENLASYLDRGLVQPGRVLDLGCGAGRNAIYLASRGFVVEAVDLSLRAVEWATERARAADAEVHFHCGDAFQLSDAELGGSFDLVYDSGCFHHVAPHRRPTYLAFLDRFLAPGGHFGLACFASGGIGSDLSDAAIYRGRDLHGGLAYDAHSLRWIFAALEEVELRRMTAHDEASPLFGLEFLWTALFTRPAR